MTAPVSALDWFAYARLQDAIRHELADHEPFELHPDTRIFQAPIAPEPILSIVNSPVTAVTVRAGEVLVTRKRVAWAIDRDWE